MGIEPAGADADAGRDPLDDETVIGRFAGEPVDQDSIAHYRGLLHHALLINRCNECSTWHHPPRPLCPACWSFDVGVQPVAGTGTIALLTFLELDGRAPHPVVTVELDEQTALRYTATIDGATTPDSIGIGDRVELVWIERSNSMLPAFRSTDATNATGS